MQKYDYIIVGAGSAGTVLAYRLSENPGTRVLLLEAGPEDNHPLIEMPKGFGKILTSPRHCWYFPIEREGAMVKPEVWVRGKTLGGSSSVNGQLYVRGFPEDYDEWARLGAEGWDWQHMLPCFKAMERHALGANEYRGGDGPLDISIPANPLHPALRAFIAAGQEMGLPYKQDLNAPGDTGIGPYPQNVSAGRRVSGSTAFLHPARNRHNLRILTAQQIDKVVFDGIRAVAVTGRGPGGLPTRFQGEEIILCAGAIITPKILQLSGIGPARHLGELGIPVVHDNPEVGQNMQEHRYLRFQYRLKRWASYNREFEGPRLLGNLAHYYLRRKGILASGAFDAGAAVKTSPELKRSDVFINMLPATMAESATKRFAFEPHPGMQVIAYRMRPTSRGSVLVKSPNPDHAPVIRANYLSTDDDRAAAVRMVGYVRRMFQQPALKELVEEETLPGPSVNTPDDIVATILATGGPCQHASGTCRMGNDAASVVDPQLRVRGVQGLRVVDASIMPRLVSGNTNGPVMAMAWRAADIILRSPARADAAGAAGAQPAHT